MLQAEAFITVSCTADFTPYGSFGGDAAFVTESSPTYTTPALTELHFGITPSGIANELDCFPAWVFVNSLATFTAYGTHGGSVNFITNTPEELYSVPDLEAVDFPTLPPATINSIFSGIIPLVSVYIGSVQVACVYIGSVQVFGGTCTQAVVPECALATMDDIPIITEDGYYVCLSVI